MTDRPPATRKAGFPWPVLAAAALPLAYLASTGPVALMIQGRTPPTWVEYVYFPIDWGWRNSGLFRALLEGYLKLWGVP